MKVEDLDTYISTMRKVLIERQKDAKEGYSAEKQLQEMDEAIEDTMKNSILGVPFEDEEFEHVQI